MSIFLFLSGTLFAFLLIDIMKKHIILRSFQYTEKKLLFISMCLLQYKYQAIQLMEIVYDRASENDPSMINEKKQVINKIHEKFLLFGNEWISDLKKALPYNTEYNNWPEAIEYMEKLLIKDNEKKDN